MTCWWIWHIWFCYMCLFPDRNLVINSSNMLSQRITTGGMLLMSTFVLLVNLSSLPYFALSKWNLNSITFLNRGFPYNARISSSASENISSKTSQLSPSLGNPILVILVSLGNMSLNFAFFCNTLMGFIFPIPLKALQVRPGGSPTKV